MMPTGERRFYLGLILKQKQKEREMYENATQNSGGKGSRKKRVSGDQLKAQIKNGNVPLQ